MTIPSDTDDIPPTGFDPLVFWLQHKTKILVYVLILVVASVTFAIYQIATQRKLAESQQLFAQASTEEDYQQIVQKFPHSVAAGNATLLLAEKLRADKKYDEAIVALRGLIDQQPNYPLIDGAWLSLATTLQAQGKTDEALSTFQQVASKFATRYSAPQAMLAQAQILKDKGNFEEAKQTYQNVKAQFPESLFANEAMRDLTLMRK